MIKKELIKQVRNYSFENSEKDDIHGFLHIERVRNLCLQLGKEMNANLLLLEIAALLHDIGRKSKNKEINHANISADITKNYLSSINYNFSKGEIDQIIHCIKSHSFSNKIIPQTLEAKILSDADKLDAMGAIGLYRTIAFTAKNHNGIDTVIKHMEDKILDLKRDLNLNESKILAEERQQILMDFYKKIQNEK